MASSQNGYAVQERSGFLRTWDIPTTDRHLIMRDGSAGFLLADFALWFHQKVEPLNKGVWDDWGWADRNVRGSSDISNHASGTAMDLNAVRHPLGAQGTFAFKVGRVLKNRKVKQVWAYALIRTRLRLRYRGAIRWGGDYDSRKDEMHFEINKSLPFCEKRAKRLMKTKRGRWLLAANPGAKAAILS